ncbi:MAG: hypothetical protein OQK73_10600 [Gammaproteobacteria bacterium]|nr:hypothetical protein [Gammaproteobacteria bacterium]
MSDGISLSDEFMNQLFEAVIAHDKAAESDMTLGLQYLAAVIGYWSASYPGSDNDRDELLNHLSAFSKHVGDQQAAAIKQAESQSPQASAPQQSAPAGKSVATDDPAMGVWKPE